MPSASRPRLFTIPPHADFLATLAWAMRAGRLPGGDATAGGAGQGLFPAFAGWRIYLPTRRAARELAAAMLRQTAQNDAGARAQILPRILPLGDVDEDELQLSAWEDPHHAPESQLPPPAIAPLPRLFALARFMRAWARDGQAEQWRLAEHLRAHPGAALRLARSLAAVLDSFENEEVPLREVARLWRDEPIMAERAEHLLAAQHLLQYLARKWPEYLKERGLTGAAARRARLIDLEAKWLAENPPETPVIAAGSTGSLPATARLLSVIARLPAGCVVLPGLDVEMDEASWKALEPGHPQYGMKVLLERLEADRGEVVELAGPRTDGHGAARALLLREALRPVATTDKWREHLRQQGRDATMLADGARGLHLLTAPTRRQEALAIALLMREVLEQPGRTCMLITPDRQLARAVRAELARWNVTVDDSAGEPLIDTLSGTFLKLLWEAALEGFSAVHVMALLRHPLACFGLAPHECAQAAADLELLVLRPHQRPLKLTELEELTEAAIRLMRDETQAWRLHPNARHLSAARVKVLRELAARAARLLSPLAQLAEQHEARTVTAWLETLLAVAESLTTPIGESHSLLWQGDAGEALAAALAEMLRQAREDDTPQISLADLAAFLRTELAARVMRPRQPAHARLFILGLLEARLLKADRVILGGLNEGIWPQLAQNDPWLNRQDREALSLPLPERRMGLSAHDFTQAAAGCDVWLTCALRIDQQPAEPARWLVRLQAVLKAVGLDELLRRESWPLRLAARLDVPAGDASPVTPPRPAPPAHLRPASISASRVRTLLRDPYAIFARDVLRLQPLDSLAPRATPALFGTMVHAALEEFVRRWPDVLPDNAAQELLALLEEKHAEFIGDEAHLAQVRGRLWRMAEAWIRECEMPWRADGGLLRAHAECEGRMTFTLSGGRAFTLRARADRIDVLAQGGLRIIDYKTGQLPARNPASAAYDPQMDLEAAIAFNGGFEVTGSVREVRELVLARLSGGDDEPVKTDKWHTAGARQLDRRDARTRARDALEGLRRLLDAYMDEAQPYLPLDHGSRERRPGDYDHLNRWREWLALLTRDDT